jgi:hypothetical protein
LTARAATYWSLPWELTKLAIDMQVVMAMRMFQMSTGRLTTAEAKRMVSEKLLAGQRAQRATLSSSDPSAVAARVTRVFGRSVAANRRRLTQ